MVAGILKNKEFNCWLIAFLVLAFFSTFLVNIAFAQSNMQNTDPQSKMRVGDTFDLSSRGRYWDGYTLLIKQIDLGKKEVLMEIQLNGSYIREKRLTKNEIYKFRAEGSGRISTLLFNVRDISQDDEGKYAVIDISKSGVGGWGGWHNFVTLNGTLNITSIPTGANIFDENKVFLGKTSKTGTKIRVDDLKKHYIRLEMPGYENKIVYYKFEKFEKMNQINKRVVLNKK